MSGAAGRDALNTAAPGGLSRPLPHCLNASGACGRCLKCRCCPPTFQLAVLHEYSSGQAALCAGQPRGRHAYVQSCKIGTQRLRYAATETSAMWDGTAARRCRAVQRAAVLPGHHGPPNRMPACVYAKSAGFTGEEQGIEAWKAAAHVAGARRLGGRRRLADMYGVADWGMLAAGLRVSSKWWLLPGIASPAPLPAQQPPCRRSCAAGGRLRGPSRTALVPRRRLPGLRSSLSKRCAQSKWHAGAATGCICAAACPGRAFFPPCGTAHQAPPRRRGSLSQASKCY